MTNPKAKFQVGQKVTKRGDGDIVYEVLSVEGCVEHDTDHTGKKLSKPRKVRLYFLSGTGGRTSEFQMKRHPVAETVTLLDLISDLEWVGGIHGYHCQICGYNHDYGHDPRCPLVKVFPHTRVFKPGRGWDKKWIGLDRYRP